jgi:DNA-binding transcriptional LysR family regulator
MANPGVPTFEQLNVFVAVAEEGSFAAAAKRLGRAVSVVSYAVANLEAQLGLALFERQNTRKPVLTPAGGTMLAEAKVIARGFDNLLAKAKGLLDGLEAEIEVAVDVMLPCGRVGAVLSEFRNLFPSVSLRLHAETLSAVTAMVDRKEAAIGISGPFFSGVDTLEQLPAGLETIVPVAAPSHPIARLTTIDPGEVFNHTQLALNDRAMFGYARTPCTFGPHVWRTADLGAMMGMLRDGIGWGHVPLAMAQEDLAKGSLVQLVIPEHPGGTYRFAGIWRRDMPPGPAGRWLVDRFVALGAQDIPVPEYADI